MNDPSRRRFLQSLLTGSAAAAVSVGVQGCLPRDAPAPPVDVDAFVAHGQLTLDLTKLPQLAQPGGAITARSGLLPTPVLIVNDAAGFFTVSSTCTHVGCPLGYDGSDVVCPCHQSRFSPYSGAVLNPPAAARLSTYATRFDAETQTLVVEFATPNFPEVNNGLVTFTFAQFPQLRVPGGQVTGTPVGATRPIYVLALAPTGYSAVDPTCPHQQCKVAYQPVVSRFICPCHNSAFETNGALVTGPATKALSSFPVTADAAGVTVRLT